jgi:hypothetical protein
MILRHCNSKVGGYFVAFLDFDAMAIGFRI